MWGKKLRDFYYQNSCETLILGGFDVRIGINISNKLLSPLVQGCGILIRIIRQGGFILWQQQNQLEVRNN